MELLRRLTNEGVSYGSVMKDVEVKGGSQFGEEDDERFTEEGGEQGL